MDEPREAELTPLYDVVVLDRLISELLALAMADSPVRPSEYAVLSAIELIPGTTASRLASEFSVPLTTVTEWLVSLTAVGLIDRERDPGDLRRRRLSLTPAGEAAIALARKDFGRAYLSFLRHTDEDPARMREQLAVMISGVRNAIGELRTQGSAVERP